jgi:hypothetical protein
MSNETAAGQQNSLNNEPELITLQNKTTAAQTQMENKSKQTIKELKQTCSRNRKVQKCISPQTNSSCSKTLN